MSQPFLIRLANGIQLIVEIKGQGSPQDQAKRRYLDEWVNAVNGHGGFGGWKCGGSFEPSDLPAVIHQASNHRPQ